MEQRPFVLSGGGTRGFAHLGVVKALEEHGLSPSALSGTSAGAMAGAFLANGFTPDEVMEMFVGKVGYKMLSWNSFHMGLVSMKHIVEFLDKNLRYKTFGELRFPLYITATNFLDGRQRIFSEGDLIEAVVASCSVPVVFPPVFIDGVPYVDGGLSNDLPVEPFAGRKHETVCIYVNPVREFVPKKGLMDVLDRAWHLSFREMVTRSAEGCYLYIEPFPLHCFSMYDINKLSEIFELGYHFTRKLIADKLPGQLVN